jgi:TctA family transporter
MSALLVGAGVAVGIAFVGSVPTWLLVMVLAVPAVVAIGVIAAVIRQARSDPAGLMLGQITGTEYESIRRLTLGDSSRGERVEDVVAGFSIQSPGQVPSSAQVDPAREEST